MTGAIDNAAAHTRFVNQRAAAAAQWDHGAYEVRAMCTTRVVRQPHTHTHSQTHIPVHKGHFRCELHKVSLSLVALPAPSSFSLCPPATLSTLITLLCDVFKEKISFGSARAFFNENST